MCVCVFSEQDGWMSIGVLRQQCPSFAHPFSLSLILLHPPPPHNLSPCLLIDLWAWHRRRAKESIPSPIERIHCLLKHSLSHLHEWMLLCFNKWTIKKAGRQNVITKTLEWPSSKKSQLNSTELAVSGKFWNSDSQISFSTILSGEQTSPNLFIGHLDI